MIITRKFVINVNSGGDIIDLTDRIYSIVREMGVNDALVAVLSPFSYTSIGIMEYDPGLVKDFSRFFNKILPNNNKYEHNIEWNDNFANVYLKSFLVGNSAIVPFVGGEFELDRFMRILLFDFSSMKGARSVIIQIVY